jgi:hypothetical protein
MSVSKKILYLVVAVTLTVGAAWAISPNFHYADASINQALDLAVSFKESGLGNTGFSDVTIQVAANNTALYQCFNGGGNHPRAGNKETVSGPVVGSGQFPVDNGQTTGVIPVAPVGPGNFACPPGQFLFLQSTSFTDITITDVTVGDGPVPTTPDTVTGSGHIPVQ